MLKKILIKTFVFFCVATLLTGKSWAGYTEAVIADNSLPKDVVNFAAPQYFNPVNRTAPRSPSTTTGTRSGGCFDSETSPYLLAPASLTGETATALPTFTWFLPDDAPVLIEFSLYALHSSGSIELKHSKILPYESGLVQYQLPAEAAIETEKNYMWQVVLHCDPNRPSQSLVYESEVVFTSNSQVVASTESTIEQSRALAEAGYWYDAIAVLGTSETLEVAEMRAILLNDLVLLEAAINGDSVNE